MRKTILLLAAALAFASCRQGSDIPFEEVRNYFFRSDAELPENPVIDTSGQFDALFGAAALMGRDGRPTVVDFGKEFVIAVVNPVTDCRTELVPESLRKEDGELVFTYQETIGERQSWAMRPVLLVKVERVYKGEAVRLERRLQVIDQSPSE